MRVPDRVCNTDLRQTARDLKRIIRPYMYVCMYVCMYVRVTKLSYSKQNCAELQELKGNIRVFARVRPTSRRASHDEGAIFLNVFVLGCASSSCRALFV